MQGTREVVLQIAWSWAEKNQSQKPIFWLCDIAGSGKSTVAMSAAERWRTEGILGGQFFFSMASSEGSNTEKFCSTIARDLVHHIPALAPHIAEAVKRKPSIIRSSFEEQFRTLIADPISRRPECVILVIDALDECKSASQRKELLDTLAMATRESKNLKIFITSRPDPVVEAVLQPLSIKAKVENRLHDANHSDNIDDIATYVHQSLNGVLSRHKREQLVAKANGLFIWASIACRMLKSETNLSTPESIHDRLISVDKTAGIDDVYDLVFERIDAESRTVMCSMLALLLAAFEPLTMDNLDDLIQHAGVQGSARALVRNLGSVLTEDQTTHVIQFRHPTLVEYLRRRSIASIVGNRARIHLDFVNAHGQAASWCLKRLTSRRDGPKFNICGIESSFYLNRQIPDLATRVSKFISRELRYASLYWLFHVAETDSHSRDTIKNHLRHVIRSPNILYWMEILSVIGGVPRVTAGIRAVTSRVGVSSRTR